MIDVISKVYLDETLHHSVYHRLNIVYYIKSMACTIKPLINSEVYVWKMRESRNKRVVCASHGSLNAMSPHRACTSAR